MPTYQATASKAGADGKFEFVASHEFEASDTVGAMAAADAWSKSKDVASSGSITIRLYAGKVLLCERALSSSDWTKTIRP